MPEKRIFHPRTRVSGVRDARLIIIAAEGTKTEKSYFEDLAIAYSTSKVHVEVLERLNTSSSPSHVLAQLDSFKNNYRIRSGYDELWLVVDVDRWGKEKLSEVCRLALQKDYKLAVSNPCFEIWLLLHHRSLLEYSEDDLQRLQENKKDGTNRNFLERELVSILGRYHKEHPETEDFIPYVKKAIEHAQNIDHYASERWPNNLGTRVYKLAYTIIAFK